MYFLSNYFT